VDPSTPLTFSFCLNIQKPYWNVFAQLGITTPEGLKLILDTTNSEQFTDLLTPGRYEISISLPPLWLRPMVYSSRIKIIAHPENGPTERFYSEWIDIPVEGGNQSESVADRILVPQSAWHVRAVE
jgi:hypothetical protein